MELNTNSNIIQQEKYGSILKWHMKKIMVLKRIKYIRPDKNFFIIDKVSLNDSNGGKKVEIVEYPSAVFG